MTWYQKAMKDVAGCEKPRGAAKQVSIRGFPNGVTHPAVRQDIPAQAGEQTEGSETSQYLLEKKKPLISSVAASERETV